MTTKGQGSVLLTTTIASFSTAFMGSSLNIALPMMGREFGMDAVALGWIATAYSLAVAIFLVPFGRAADIHGRKRVFAYGLAAYVVMTTLSIFATSGEALIGLRALQGASAAMMFATSSAILSSAYPPHERGRVLGINVASVYIGLSMGPFIGGILTQNLGWRSIFVVGAVVGAVAAVAAFRLKAEWAEARGEKFDWVGSVIYGAAIAVLMVGMSQLPALEGAILLAAGVAGIAGFVAWEARAAAPILNLSLFRGNRVFALSNIAALINYLATTAVTFLLSLYLQYIKGLTPQAAGFVLVAQPIMMAIFSPLAGQLSDRVESRYVASAGMALSAAGLIMMAFLGPATSFAYIVASLLLVGLGFGLFSSPNMNAIMGSAERRLYGVASAILATMRTVGQMLSLGLTLLLFSVIIGPVPVTPEVHPQFLQSARIAFSVFSVLCFLGVFASMARGNVRENGRV